MKLQSLTNIGTVGTARCNRQQITAACFWFYYVTWRHNQVAAKGYLSYFVRDVSLIWYIFDYFSFCNSSRKIHKPSAFLLPNGKATLMSVWVVIFLTECLKHLVIPFRPSQGMETVLVPEGLGGKKCSYYALWRKDQSQEFVSYATPKLLLRHYICGVPVIN